MFSSGQWAFVIFFIIAFITAMLFAYRRDLKVHRKHYKGSFWVLLGFLVFMTILVLIKKYA